jgi:hypothetical protein
VLFEVLVVEPQLHVWAVAGGQQEEGQDDGKQQEDLQTAVMHITKQQL